MEVGDLQLQRCKFINSVYGDMFCVNASFAGILIMNRDVRFHYFKLDFIHPYSDHTHHIILQNPTKIKFYSLCLGDKYYLLNVIEQFRFIL